MENVQDFGKTSDDEVELTKKGNINEPGKPQPVISVMLAVVDTPAAVVWYKKALGATELWHLGSVAGLEIAGAAFFLGEPANNGWENPAKLGITSARVEVFCDDPDTFIARAMQAGANGSFDKIKNHEAPWESTGKEDLLIRLEPGSDLKETYLQPARYVSVISNTGA